MSELKNCPFCGKEPELVIFPSGREGIIPDCECVVGKDETAWVTPRFWNRRPIESALQSRVDALTIPADVREAVIKAIDLQIRWTKAYVIDSDESLDNLQRALDYFGGK
jgi:hypothetical protein